MSYPQMAINKLTNAALRAAKPTEKPYKLTAKKVIANGADPSARRQAEKSATANSFEAIAREWLALQEKKLAPGTFAKAVWTLETLVYPYIG